MTSVVIFEVFLLVYNNVVNLLPSELHARIYVWLNFGILLLVWFWAKKRLKLQVRDIGFTTRMLGRSILCGLGLTALIIIPALALRQLLPSLGISETFVRLEGFSRAELWWRVLVRIPIGTGLFEEVLFRGIFYGYLVRHYSPSRALFQSSLFFAFWHIMPALKVILVDFRITAPLPLLGLWLIGLAGAFMAGMVFAWLRMRTESIVACLIAHILINDIFLIMVCL